MRQQAGVADNQIEAATTGLTDDEAAADRRPDRRPPAADRRRRGRRRRRRGRPAKRRSGREPAAPRPPDADRRRGGRRPRPALGGAGAGPRRLGGRHVAGGDGPSTPAEVQAARQAEATAAAGAAAARHAGGPGPRGAVPPGGRRRPRGPGHLRPRRADSDDPVEQVSVSVIGEGEIQLRGPLKGINEIRMMINQIDAPVGQVADRRPHRSRSTASAATGSSRSPARIGVHVDQARFLTLQSAQIAAQGRRPRRQPPRRRGGGPLLPRAGPTRPSAT